MKHGPADPGRWPDPETFSTPGDFLHALATVRAEANLPQTTVAARAGLSAGTIGTLVNRSTCQPGGRPPAPT